MLSKLRYDERFTKAFQQVFGKTIVCPNLQAASQYARSHGVSAITPDGDRSDKKGALTGGYHDSRNSRIDAMKRFAAARRESEEQSDRKAELSRKLRSLDQQVTKAGSDLQKLQENRQNMDGGYGPLADSLHRRGAELHSRRDELAAKQRQRETLEALVRDQSQQLSDFETELASAFKKDLSDEEERLLKEVSDALGPLRTQNAQISAQRSALETQKTEIEIELRENLRLRLDQLQAQDADADVAGDGSGSSSLKERQRDLKRVAKALDAVKARLNENERSIEEAQQQMQAQEASRAEKQQEVDNLNKAIREQQRAFQKFAQKRGTLLSRMNDVEAAIRALGALPELAHTATYRNMSSHTAAHSGWVKISREPFSPLLGVECLPSINPPASTSACLPTFPSFCLPPTLSTSRTPPLSTNRTTPLPTNRTRVQRWRTPRIRRMRRSAAARTLRRIASRRAGRRSRA